jgi:putative redox protein
VDGITITAFFLFIMVQIFAEYEGNLKVALQHEPSQSSLHTSAPKDNQGLGDDFSPTDLLATSLLSCMITLMGIEARRRSLDISGTKGRIEKHMVADPFRRIGTLVVNVDVNGTMSEEDTKALRYVAENCPVRKSISDSIVVETTYSFRQL